MCILCSDDVIFGPLHIIHTVRDIIIHYLLQIAQVWQSSVSSMASKEEPSGVTSAAQRARSERNRLRARALREARLATRASATPIGGGGVAIDTGGGFLLEDASEPAARVAPLPAPVVDPAERPECLECGRTFAHSHLLDTFEYAVCDDCRDEEGAHSLITRTEAKAEYLLQDVDLDLRGGPLPCVRRRNPHSSRGDMRLYLRAQVEARALLVWGSEEKLEEELEARAMRRAESRARRGARALRALRMSVRSSLFAGARPPHEHVWQPETYDEATDTYERACACGHKESYEKM